MFDVRISDKRGKAIEKPLIGVAERFALRYCRSFNRLTRKKRGKVWAHCHKSRDP